MDEYSVDYIHMQGRIYNHVGPWAGNRLGALSSKETLLP